MQAAFNNHQTGDNGNGENDFEFRIDMNDLNDAIGNDSEEELALGDLKNFFNSRVLGIRGGHKLHPVSFYTYL